jgi:hypothetical protein
MFTLSQYSVGGLESFEQLPYFTAVNRKGKKKSRVSCIYSSRHYLPGMGLFPRTKREGRVFWFRSYGFMTD